MEKYKVRTATLEDLSILLRFEQGIITAERPFDITLKEDPINYYDLRQMISSDEAEVVVVEHNSRIIGSGHATIKAARPYLDHKVYAYLGFMYTDAEYRGKGVNRLIIDALRQWSLDRGLNEVRLTVYTDNLAAIRAYEKVGFKQHMIEMRMDRDKLS